jgi:uncharacterized protein (TIGR03435 family)
MTLFNRNSAIFAALILLFTAAIPSVSAQSQAQTPSGPASDFKYEVASIKPTISRPNSHSSRSTEDGFEASNSTLLALIRQAYGLPVGGGTADDGRVVGAPGWANSDGYDLNAKIDPDVIDALKKLSVADRQAARQQMLQELLADRFHLVIHKETKDLPVYFLVSTKNGPKLHEADPNNDYAKGYKLPDGRPAGRGFDSDAPGEVTAQGVTIANLCAWLSRQVGRTVIDKTGLSSRYDFSLQFSPDSRGEDSDSSAGPNGLNIFGAVQQQLGLKLDSGKGATEIIVVDHAEKPTEN